MLQKKLKSLDANTTANQKNSESLMKSEDFLNKYGDEIVFKYMQENTDLCLQLDDPLNLFEEDKDTIQIGAASKVSGRVAVLPVLEQEKFYTEILERYQEHIKQLIEDDKFDLRLKHKTCVLKHWKELSYKLIELEEAEESSINDCKRKSANELSYVKELKDPYHFKLIVSASKQVAGNVYLEEDILSAIVGNSFEKVSATMTALVHVSNLGKVLNTLGSKLKVSAELSPEQFKIIADEVNLENQLVMSFKSCLYLIVQP
ncbi:DNA helicase [Sarracenia purpurea var. burkii]